MKSLFAAVILCFMLLGSVFKGSGQGLLPSDTLVFVSGKVLDSESLQPLQAFFVYQKIPNGGNVGSTSSKSGDGSYGLTLLKSSVYDVSIEVDGYFPLETKVETNEFNNERKIHHDFKMVKNNVGATLVLESLIFDPGKATIRKESYRELDDLAVRLTTNKKMKIQLEGHTDYRGSAKANLELSKKRVEATKDYLVSKGVSSKSIKVKSFGGSQPIVRTESLEQRKVNRRVEVRILAY